ncbi:hypothetical protein SAY87_013924 [Trapa incisa]|uniref:Uncharacterized protein n=1 Tax=Trapa incisa TaxID=236973 RepID=A0AAN7KCR0_9MYRT|nr:hypothetical protein SAY87_013924 [Trapa incisa]
MILKEFISSSPGLTVFLRSNSSRRTEKRMIQTARILTVFQGETGGKVHSIIRA